jgi:predicted Zn-dependent protease
MKLRPFRLPGIVPILIAIVLVALAALPSCTTTPITGRKQLSLISTDQMTQLGLTSYQDALTKATIEKDPAINAMVTRVGTKIAKAAMVDAPDAKNFEWEFTVIKDDKTVNAWCLPGGKVAVYTGILPVTQDESGLAVVIGHEVAHATAGHGRERVSRTVVEQYGQQALAAVLQKKSPELAQGVMAALGLGAQVGIDLPFSRSQESEADHIGLVYMARAGYDPGKAVEFWHRMESLGGQQPPAFLSDHPSHATRVQDLEKWMPEAQAQAGKSSDDPVKVLPPGTIPQLPAGSQNTPASAPGNTSQGLQSKTSSKK